VRPYYVYILECSDGSLYTGCTNQVARRLSLHNAGRASRYTRTRLPVSVCYIEQVGGRGDALKREAEIKKLPRTEKIRLCKGFTVEKKRITR
jgi:putative endonuclease